MKKICLLIVIVMFLLFIRDVNSQDLGCCVKTVDSVYCQVTEEDTGECDTNKWKWYRGKIDDVGWECSWDVKECERGCCILDGEGKADYSRAQCSDIKVEGRGDRFVVGECPDSSLDEIACILNEECFWGWTSEKCENERGSVDETIIDKKSCNAKTEENNANKGCCKANCNFKYRYDCNGEFEKGLKCGDVSECMDRCKWSGSECRDKEIKDIGGEIVQRDGCGGVKHVSYCSEDKYCEDGVCKNAGCVSVGIDRDHEENWCIKKGIAPGDRHILRTCLFGDIEPIPCDDYRYTVCKDTEDEMALGQVLDGAGCYNNVWEGCFDYGGNNIDDCKAKGDCGIIDGMCLPNYPPGLRFWECSNREECKERISGSEAGDWNDKMCSVDSLRGCKRSGDCEGESGVESGVEVVKLVEVKEEFEKVEVFWISTCEENSIWPDKFKSGSGDCGPHNYAVTPKGCRVYSKFCRYSPLEDECANGIILVNTIFDGTTIGDHFVKFNSYKRYNAENAKDLIKDTAWGLSNSKQSYFCGDDGYWHVCDSSARDKSLISTDLTGVTEKFRCVEEDRDDGAGSTFRFYMWKKI